MFADSYYPGFLVEKGRQILVRLCESIEAQKPLNEEGFLRITHAATREFNLLGEELEQNDSELETVAREAITEEFDLIAKSYSFDVDVEELIAPREW